MGAPHGWIGYTLTRTYPECDIADEEVYWPDFAGGGYVGSYWTLRHTDAGADTSLQFARMEITFDALTPPALP